ncbi:MAG: molybdopterin-dependent oxidoreductase, partial [Myxococcota bacterium]
MKHIRTCCLCEALCGLEVEHDATQIHTIRGHKADPLSQGHLCPKAVALKDLHTDPDRLRVPHRRHGDRWEPIGWEEALAEVADRLHAVKRQHGEDAIGWYIGNPTIHNAPAILSYALLARALPTRNRFSATSVDQLPHMVVARLMFGHQLMLPIPDIDRTDCMILVGANPAVSNGSLMTVPNVINRLKAIRRRGGKVIVLDPRHTETARLADAHHFIRPGSDALLFLAMLQVMFAEDRLADGPWRSWTDGVERLRPQVERFTPEQVATPTGLSPDTIRDLARTLAQSPSAVLYGRFGVSTQRHGALSVWLINVLNIVTGNLDRPGGAMFTHPAVDLLSLSAALGQVGDLGRWRSRVRGLPEFNGELPAAALAEEITTPGRGQIRALITLAGNPVLSTPNGAQLASALGDLDTLIAFDPYITATTRHAHIILPPVTHLERSHFGLVFHALAVRNTVSWSDPLFAPPPGARDDWQNLLDLGLHLLRRDRTTPRQLIWRAALTAARWAGPKRLIDLLVRLGPYGALRDPTGHALTLAKIEASHGGIDLGPLRPCLPGRLTTAQSRVDLAPELLLSDLNTLEQQQQHVSAGQPAEPASSPSPLVLIGRRNLRSNNSWMHNARRLVKGPDRCTLLMHPDDANARGLR